MTARTSPLDTVHRAAGARMVDFAGWDMPLSYPQGTVAEHLACRRECAVFDVSHLGTVRVEGPGTFDALQQALTNDLRRIGPGRAQYTHLLDAEDGSVLDDIIVWWVGPERFDVMPNASNTDRVTAAVPGVDVTADRAVIAGQGPSARAVLARVGPAATSRPLSGTAWTRRRASGTSRSVVCLVAETYEVQVAAHGSIDISRQVSVHVHQATGPTENAIDRRPMYAKLSSDLSLRQL